MNCSRTGILVQARMGSSRLPGKVLLPFTNGKSMLEIVVERLAGLDNHANIVVATSVSPGDDEIEAHCARLGIHCFRGDEEDVLQRFIDAAHEYEFNRILRVCADNPLIDLGLTKHLLCVGMNSEADYCGFVLEDDLPAIRSHWGIFPEIATLKALEKVRDLTSVDAYRQNVTSFIYEHPNDFEIQWLKAPPEVFSIGNARFTVDTPEDFSLMQEIWSMLAKRREPADYGHALRILDERPQFRKIMQMQIEDNRK